MMKNAFRMIGARATIPDAVGFMTPYFVLADGSNESFVQVYNAVDHIIRFENVFDDVHIETPDSEQVWEATEGEPTIHAFKFKNRVLAGPSSHLLDELGGVFIDPALRELPLERLRLAEIVQDNDEIKTSLTYCRTMLREISTKSFENWRDNTLYKRLLRTFFARFFEWYEEPVHEIGNLNKLRIERRNRDLHLVCGTGFFEKLKAHRDWDKSASQELHVYLQAFGDRISSEVEIERESFEESEVPFQETNATDWNWLILSDSPKKNRFAQQIVAQYRDAHSLVLSDNYHRKSPRLLEEYIEKSGAKNVIILSDSEATRVDLSHLLAQIDGVTANIIQFRSEVSETDRLISSEEQFTPRIIVCDSPVWRRGKLMRPGRVRLIVSLLETMSNRNTNHHPSETLSYFSFAGLLTGAESERQLDIAYANSVSFGIDYRRARVFDVYVRSAARPRKGEQLALQNRLFHLTESTNPEVGLDWYQMRGDPWLSAGQICLLSTYERTFDQLENEDMLSGLGVMLRAYNYEYEKIGDTGCIANKENISFELKFLQEEDLERHNVNSTQKCIYIELSSVASNEGVERNHGRLRRAIAELGMILLEPKDLSLVLGSQDPLRVGRHVSRVTLGRPFIKQLFAHDVLKCVAPLVRDFEDENRGAFAIGGLHEKMVQISRTKLSGNYTLRLDGIIDFSDKGDEFNEELRMNFVIHARPEEGLILKQWYS